MSEPPPGWREANRANWDERVALHMGPGGYNLAPLRAGKGVLDPISESELGPVRGLRVLHLQCHVAEESLTLAQRGAEVVGLDFSGESIRAARGLADELGLADRARFVQADLYEAPTAIPEPASFDRVLVTWGAIYWLPDLAAWARVVAFFLKPGGALYLTEGHPAALVFDDAVKGPDGMPGWFAPYFGRDAVVEEESRDYVGDRPPVRSGPTYSWMHSLSSVLGALRESGLELAWLHEHDAVPWPMFDVLRRGDDRLWRWPDKPWLPLGFSLWAERR